MGIREDFWGPAQQRSGAALVDSNPKAQVEERAAELGVTLEPGHGPVNTADGRVFQEARGVAWLPIVNPHPKALNATEQLAGLQRIADERVQAGAAAKERATAELKAARAARRKAPDSSETMAELQRCRAAVDVVDDDLALATEARDDFSASIAKHVANGTVARQDAAHKAQSSEALLAEMAPILAEVTRLGASLGRAINATNGAIANMLSNRREAEHLAQELGMNYRSSGANHLTGILAFSKAFAAGLKQEGLTVSSLRSWFGV